MTKNITSTTPIQDLGYSPDAHVQRQAELMELIRQAAPEVIADNQINLEKLKELIGQEFITSDEHYELNWAGKFAARREIQKTSSLTLHPDPSNPPNAQHMLIEGENLEVLRVLQKSYYGKVKMIYIDPPYNTGNDSFVYPDDYSETLEAYQKRTGEKNEAGYLNKQNMWKKNSRESGQYHSAWLSMMYPRLYLARNLLSDDGVIFISIDDNEAANLKILTDEIFGSENFVATAIWEKAYSPINLKKHFSSNHDYVICYAKNLDLAINNGLPRSEDANDRYSNPDNDPRGVWKSSDLSVGPAIEQKIYEIITPSGRSVMPPSGYCWRLDKDRFEEFVKDNRIWFGPNGDAVPSIKRFLTEVKETITPMTIWKYGEVGHSQDATRDLKNLFNGKAFFDYPKPVGLINRCLQLYSNSDSIILDFFAGSGTTAQAVMELNIKDKGTRQSISIQMPEILEESSEAFEAGYRTITDITRARIESVIAKLSHEHSESAQHLACAYFKLAPSNFKFWRGSSDNTDALREQLSIFQSSEKLAQSKGADEQTYMLTELLLKHGLGALGVHAISKPRQLAGVTVHRVLMADDKTMWLLFETYTDALKEEIIKAMPAQVVMLNSCFVGKKADEQLANLQLELAGLDISLTVI